MFDVLVLAAALQAQPAAADVILRVSGSGGWSLECVFQTEDGERRDRARGRGLGDFDTLRATDVMNAECRYAVDARDQMLVRFIEADGFQCPFSQTASIEECQQTFIGEAEGSFVLQRN